MADLIYSVQQVFENYLEAEQVFNIPEYQRGYKWDSQQITQLMDDINNFKTNGDDQLFYCLQNITLIKHKNVENQINVVDGQQRLTTITLVMLFLGEHVLISDKLLYSVRKPSNNFLQKLISDENLRKNVIESQNFDDFLKKYQEDYDYQDIYFMYNAFRSIEVWFYNNKETSVDIFKEKFLNHVKLIVNRVEGVNEQELFMNLNAGRVHLDGSDLVRAILITRVAREEMQEYDSDNVEDIVRLNERRVRIGWELDELNSWWSKPKVSEYYSKFRNKQIAPQETIKYNEKNQPINFLYKLWSESCGYDYIELNQFEASNIKPLELYNTITRVHRTLKDWHEDREIYHYLCYLFNNGKKMSFKTFWGIWNKPSMTRENFITELKNFLKITAFGEEPNDKNQETGINFLLTQMIDFNTDSPTNWYENEKLEPILLLLDIISHARINDEGNPLPFLSPKYFSNYKEDKEHIYPGTPRELKILKDLDSPISGINTYIVKLNEGYTDNHIEPFEQTEDEWKELTDLEQEEWRLKLKDEIHNKRPINAIGNLVLLHKSINRGFGNDYYNEKRSIVVENTKTGLYVRNHTLDIFVKKEESEDLNVWTMDDIKNNSRSIRSRFIEFFNVQFKGDEDEE